MHVHIDVVLLGSKHETSGVRRKFDLVVGVLIITPKNVVDVEILMQANFR